MRNWSQHDYYLNKLYGDVYPQPEDSGHTELARQVVEEWMSKMTTCHSVLDAGCGTGFCQPMFHKWNVKYEGVCLGQDYIEATNIGRNVKQMDFSFLEYGDGTFDMIFARHSLEHSPIPLLTLMEWYRVAKSWLGVVVPTPEWHTYVGQNHYYVLHLEQWKNLLNVAGWNVMWETVGQLEWDVKTHEMRPFEIRLMCEKKR